MNATTRALLIVAGLVATINVTVNAGNRNIIVKGSDAMVTLSQKWAQAYMVSNSVTKIRVSGGGSDDGFAALQTGSADLCESSRKIKTTEIADCRVAFGQRPDEYKVAIEAVSVYVNEQNPIKEMSMEQLADIFSGKAKSWKEFGGSDTPITIYSRENGSSSFEFFQGRVLKGDQFAISAQVMPGAAALMSAVAKDRSGIGFSDTADGRGVRALLVKPDSSTPGVAPTEENIQAEKYPLWRYLYVYVNPTMDSGEVAHYVTWMRGDEGQKSVQEAGFYPLPENLRK